jgi:hypothetical protein
MLLLLRNKRIGRVVTKLSVEEPEVLREMALPSM